MLLTLLALLQATPAAATAPPPAPASAAGTAAPAANDPLQRKVCWRDQATGTIMPPKRICMTVAERRAWLARMQGNVNTFANRPQAACHGSAMYCPD